MKYLALAALTLTACAAHPTEYTVSISPEFTAEQTEAVVAGLDDWQRAVPVTFHVQMAECAAGSDRFCYVPYKGAGVGQVGLTRRHDTTSVITMDVDAWGLQEIAAHEAGHAMGLAHDVPGTLMCWSRSCAAPTVTPADAYAWYQR